MLLPIFESVTDWPYVASPRRTNATKIAPQMSQTTSARWLAKASLTTASMIQAVKAVVAATTTRQKIANA